MSGFHNFDLQITGLPDGSFRADVLSSSAGEAKAIFSNPFDTFEIENLALHVNGLRRRGADARRRIETPSDRRAREVGRRLFEAVFSGPVGERWAVSLNRADATDSKVRLRIRLEDAADLVDVPWEFLYSPARNGYVVHDPATSLTRYVSVNRARKRLAVEGPLRVMVIISDPSDLDASERLDVEAEWHHLQEAVASQPQIELIRLPRASLTEIATAVQFQGPFHGVHFIGHGVFDQDHQDSLVVLENADGAVEMRTGSEFATVLAQSRALRFVVLNSCEGARTSREDPFAGAAHSLIASAGIPAVVAMQFTITDAAAAEFARGFYTTLAAGKTIDDAVAIGRFRIFTSGLHPEWGTPVLYLRSEDGRLFDVLAAPEDGSVETFRPVGDSTVATKDEQTRQPSEPPDVDDAAAPGWPELESLIAEHDSIRLAMEGGPPRTEQLEDVVERLRALLREAPTDRFDPSEYLTSTGRGHRVAGYSFVLSNPDPLLLDVVVDATVREDKPFGQYLGLRAVSRLSEVAPLAFTEEVVARLEAMVPRLGESSHRRMVLAGVLADVEQAKAAEAARLARTEHEASRSRAVEAAGAVPIAALPTEVSSVSEEQPTPTADVPDRFVARLSKAGRIAMRLNIFFWLIILFEWIRSLTESDTFIFDVAVLAPFLTFFTVLAIRAASTRVTVEPNVVRVRSLIKTRSIPRERVAGIHQPGRGARWYLVTTDGRRIRLPKVVGLETVRRILGSI